MLQGVRLGDFDAIDPGAIGAIQVGQDKEVSFAMKASMVSRCLWVQQLQLVLLGPANAHIAAEFDFLNNATALPYDEARENGRIY